MNYCLECKCTLFQLKLKHYEILKLVPSSVIMSDAVSEMLVILQASDKLNPLSDADIHRIDRCPDGAPRVQTHLAAGVPSS